jgi:hypothetical protein
LTLSDVVTMMRALPVSNWEFVLVRGGGTVFFVVILPAGLFRRPRQ